MLREVGKIYARAFRMVFQYPQFLLLSVGYLMINYVVRFLDARAKESQSLSLVCVTNWIWLAVYLILFVGFPLIVILMVFQIEDGSAPHEVLQVSRNYFSGFFRQGIAGMLLTLLLSLPFVCMVLYSAAMENEHLYLAVFPLWFLIGGFFGLGAISLGQRILLDGGVGSFKSAVQGIRMLNGNFKFFFTLYSMTMLIGLVFTLLRYGIGSAITGIDLFSAQVFPLKEFWAFVGAAIRTPVVYLTDFLYGVIFLPINAILPTLAYLYIKNQPVPVPPIRRKPITDN